MRLPPLDVLQNWPSPNYVNPETRGSALLVVNVVFIVLTVIVVALRLYTRIVIKSWFGLDDVFILLALVTTIALAAIVIVANQHFGWDRHVWDIPLTQFEPTLKIAMASKVVFTAAATFTRLSLHCFYYRVSKDSGKTWFTWLVHVNVAYTIGIFIAFPFLAVFICTPVKAYWSLAYTGDNCLDEGKATLAAGIINSVADLATTITPMPLVWGLRMPRRQRIGVTVLFGLGIIATIAGVVRTYYIYRSLFNEWDQTWYTYPLWISAAIEIDLGVICASAPVLKPLLARIPFCLSETCSKIISLTKSNNTGSKSSSRPTPQGSRVMPNSDSKRKGEAITAIPELSTDRGKSYELKDWEDTERGTLVPATNRSSQEAILENETASTTGKGFRGMWNKTKATDDDLRGDMTITRTSEFELQIEPASDYDLDASSSHHTPPSSLPNDRKIFPLQDLDKPSQRYR